MAHGARDGDRRDIGAAARQCLAEIGLVCLVRASPRRIGVNEIDSLLVNQRVRPHVDRVLATQGVERGQRLISSCVALVGTVLRGGHEVAQRGKLCFRAYRVSITIDELVDTGGHLGYGGEEGLVGGVHECPPQESAVGGRQHGERHEGYQQQRGHELCPKASQTTSSFPDFLVYGRG